MMGCYLLILCVSFFVSLSYRMHVSLYLPLFPCRVLEKISHKF